MTNVIDATTTSRELPLEPDGEVDILLPVGSVRLRGTDGDRVVVRTRSGRPVDEVLAVDAAPGRIRIRELEHGYRLGPIELRAPLSADIDIAVPRGARVVVHTLSADVEAAGIRGQSRWFTASGDLRLDVEGGPVTAESMSGDIVLAATVAVDLTARSVSGDLQLRGPRFDALVASTTSGDVRLDAGLGGGAAHRISSVSGDVQLVTPSSVTVDTETITGDVRVSGRHTATGGRGRRSISFGSGSGRVVIRTTSGDIRLAAGPGTDDAGAPPPDPSAGSRPGTTAGASSTARESAASAGGSPNGQAAPVGAPTDRPQPITDDMAPSLVAEAEAAPNLVRSESDATSVGDRAPVGTEGHDEPAASPADTPDADRDNARLEVLRALERGELDVETALRRLDATGEGGVGHD